MLLSTPKSIGNRRTINLSQFDFWFFQFLFTRLFAKDFPQEEEIE